VDVAGEEGADLAQHLVADEMAVAVVDRLEAVEVANHENAVRPAAPRRGERPVELREEAAAVEEPSQLVGDREAFEIVDASLQRRQALLCLGDCGHRPVEDALAVGLARQIERDEIVGAALDLVRVRDLGGSCKPGGCASQHRHGAFPCAEISSGPMQPPCQCLASADLPQIPDEIRGKCGPAAAFLAEPAATAGRAGCLPPDEPSGAGSDTTRDYGFREIVAAYLRVAVR